MKHFVKDCASASSMFDNNMTIGIDLRSSSAAPTGVGMYAKGLLHALFSIDQAHAYVLWHNSFEKNTTPFLGEYPNVSIVETRIPNKLLHTSVCLFQKPTLDRMVCQQARRPDIWFSPNIHFTALTPNIPHVLTVHDLSFEHVPETYSWKRRAWHQLVRPREQCWRAAAIVTPSEYTKWDVARTYEIDPKKITVVSPVFLGQVEQKPVSDDIKKIFDIATPYVLCVGTIEPRKNILATIAAFQKSGLGTRGYRLVFAGPRGWKCRNIMRTMKNTPGVIYAGYVSESEKRALYAHAMLVAYPSIYEGFGFPLLEAFAAGTAVIAANRTALFEVGGDAPWYVHPDRIDDMAAAMQAIADDAALRTSMILKGQDRVRTFTSLESARTLAHLFERVRR